MTEPSTDIQGGQFEEQLMASETKAEEHMDLYDKPAAGHEEMELCLPEGCGLPVAEGGGVLSPLSGAYLLIVLSEPMSDQHKSKMIQKLRQGKQFIRNHFRILLVQSISKVLRNFFRYEYKNDYLQSQYCEYGNPHEPKRL